MYIVAMAARIRNSSLLSEVWNAAAAPWKLVWKLAGSAIAFSACWIAVTAAAQRGALGEIERDGGRRELARDG